uniref:Uncharacterized protein n=1 Tax=Iridovirus LCIVAC01 TaxID=2506607 RepID=A0A481YPQ1_9VIRU|nr:MAG: hypothetical protein LCIVAC01_00170 [Iridovirus LCIVAC01]
MLAEEHTQENIPFAKKLINDFCIVNHYYINMKYMIEDITGFLVYIENHLNDMDLLDLISSQLDYFEAILFPLRAMWDQTTRIRCRKERKENRNKLMNRLIDYFKKTKNETINQFERIKKKYINIQYTENI